MHHINFNFGDKYYILNIETGTETETETETKIGQIGEAKKVDFSNFVNWLQILFFYFFDFSIWTILLRELLRDYREVYVFNNTYQYLTNFGWRNVGQSKSINNISKFFRKVAV